jgi:hypothetical protein
MKIKLVLLVIIAVGLFSCEKTTIIPEDSRCINLIVDNQNELLLNVQQLDTIKSLFERNNLNYSNLQFFKIDSTPYGKYAEAYQYVNNLKLFTDEMIYHFDLNSSLTFMSDSQRVTTINLINVPRLTTGQVRYLFMKELEKDHFYTNTSNSADSIEIKCINVEFGYYDLNAGTSFQPKKYTIAWRVHPSYQEFPYAYINDRTGNIIYYFDGIIIGK